MTKDEILERYLNTVYFGNSAYGVQAAAESYFGKNVGELDWPQAALLAAMIRDPRDYDPFVNPQLAIERRHIALQRLVETADLSQAAADLYSFTPLPTQPSQVASPAGVAGSASGGVGRSDESGGSAGSGASSGKAAVPAGPAIVAAETPGEFAEQAGSSGEAPAAGAPSAAEQPGAPAGEASAEPVVVVAPGSVTPADEPETEAPEPLGLGARVAAWLAAQAAELAGTASAEKGPARTSTASGRARVVSEAGTRVPGPSPSA